MAFKQQKLAILKLVSDARLTALCSDRRATAEHAGVEASHNEWDSHNPDDGVGGMSCNPYHPERSKARMEEARKYHKFMQEVHNLAVETFVE